MKSPVFEAGWSKFTGVQKTSEFRGQVKAYQSVLKLIGKRVKPSPEMVALAKEVEELLAQVQLKKQ